MKNQNNKLPLLARLFLRLLVLDEDYDQYSGDMSEAYLYKRGKDGKLLASVFLLRQILTSTPRLIISNIYWG